MVGKRGVRELNGFFGSKIKGPSEDSLIFFPPPQNGRTRTLPEGRKSCHAESISIHDYLIMFENLFSERGLSLDRLKVLVEVHDSGSISKAAPGDPIRQSQYSRQLRELSEFFGCEVARRQGKLLKLTAHGKRLAELSRAQLRGLQDFRAECHAESIDYTIGAGDSLLQWLVIPRLGKVATGKKGTHFATSSLRTNEIIHQLKEGRIDFGIVRRDAVPDSLKCVPLGVLHFVAVVPKTLAKGRKPSLQEIFSELPFTTQTTDGQFTERLRAVAHACKSELSPALACQSFPQATSAVHSGAYAAILPKIALPDLPSDENIIIQNNLLEQLHRPIALAWNPRVTAVRPLAGKLASELRAALQFG
jgi:DNA-binding transcriptional LysR family regulator